MARASPASIVHTPVCSLLSATVDLNEAIDASMDSALKVFDEMDTRYAFISLPFNILALLAGDLGTSGKRIWWTSCCRGRWSCSIATCTTMEQGRDVDPKVASAKA